MPLVNNIQISDGKKDGNEGILDENQSLANPLSVVEILGKNLLRPRSHRGRNDQRVPKR